MLLNFKQAWLSSGFQFASMVLGSVCITVCGLSAPAWAEKTDVPESNLASPQGERVSDSTRPSGGTCPPLSDFGTNKHYGPGTFAGKPWAKFGPEPLDLTPLNLTTEQKDKIKEIRKETGLKTRDYRQQLREKRVELQNLMFDPKATEGHLRNKHSEMRKLQEQAEDTMFRDFLAIRALLTPEQKAHLPEVKPPLRDFQRAEGHRSNQPPKAAPEAKDRGDN